MALTLWLLGYPDQALQQSHAALALSQELAHPYSRAIALGWAAFLSQHRRDERATQEQAEAVIALSAEQGFLTYLAWGTILGGWALAAQEQGEEGIAQIRRGLAAYQATGQKVYWPGFVSLLAEVYGKEGQTEEGLIVLAEALAVVNTTGQCWYEAELYRLKGELTLQKLSVAGYQLSVTSTQHPAPNTQSEAEVCFLKAIEIARQQQAKSLELRAVMSLARLWQQQDKKEEAHQMLAEVYGWFTEGFATKDLQEAQALIEELNH
ncbi:MAG TPA: hypothetical protein VGX03_09670 [Candidatus Binatia bacterium]|nr:hypothetical protein [Candidatus Binatia bacterium]